MSTQNHPPFVTTAMLPLSPRQDAHPSAVGKALLTGTTGTALTAHSTARTSGGTLLPTLQSLLCPVGTMTSSSTQDRNGRTAATLPTKLLFGTLTTTDGITGTTSPATAAEIAAEALRISRQSQQYAQDRSSDLVLLPKEKNNHDTAHKPSNTTATSTTANNNSNTRPTTSSGNGGGGGSRLNKFVKRLHDMLQAEKDGGVIEWRKGLLVLHSTADFAKHILPKFFNTKNFKTFRRQLNYYGFVHVRSFSTAAANTTTALWVNQELAEQQALSADIASVLTLKRVEPCEMQKTAEGRRQRKEMALHTVEEDLHMDPKTLQLEQIQNHATATVSHLTRRRSSGTGGVASAATGSTTTTTVLPNTPVVPLEITFAQTPSTAGTTTASVTRLLEQPPLQRHSTVVSDDTQSRTSSSSGQASEGGEMPPSDRRLSMDEDSLGAANLLLMLSRVRR